MSSHDGSRSVRQSKRYSVTALYLSMSAKDKELEIEDDLAKGTIATRNGIFSMLIQVQPRRCSAS